MSKLANRARPCQTSPRVCIVMLAVHDTWFTLGWVVFSGRAHGFEHQKPLQRTTHSSSSCMPPLIASGHRWVEPQWKMATSSSRHACQARVSRSGCALGYAIPRVDTTTPLQIEAAGKLFMDATVQLKLDQFSDSGRTMLVQAARGLLSGTTNLLMTFDAFEVWGTRGTVPCGSQRYWHRCARLSTWGKPSLSCWQPAR